MKVLGPRVLVKEDEVTTGVEARAKAAGLVAVVDEKNRPKPTSGEVVALGDDPIFDKWGLKEGSRVTFGTHSGEYYFHEGTKYRLLEWQEIKIIL